MISLVAAIAFKIGMRHPDFSKVRVKPENLRRAISAASEYLLSIIQPQVPVRTGQLVASYRLSETGSIGAARTTRWDSHLLNSQLARILRARGYLDIQIGAGHKRQATIIARDALGGRSALKFEGMITLS